MKEYSDNLPTNPPTEQPEVLNPVETLEGPGSIVQPPLEGPTMPISTPDIQPVPVPEQVNENKSNEVLDPFANIFNAPANVDNAPVENNKFFNQLEDEPVSLDTLSPFSAEGVFNIDNTPRTDEISSNSNIEVFDINAGKEEKTETPQPVEEQTSTIMNELNPNNKFFQPINNMQQEMVPLSDVNKEEKLINPMDMVEELDVPNVTSSVNENYNNAIKDIKSVVDRLKTQGININIDETDLENKHQIIIQIEK